MNIYVVVLPSIYVSPYRPLSFFVLDKNSILINYGIHVLWKQWLNFIPSGDNLSNSCLMSLILMLDSWRKLMPPFNHHAKQGRKMFHIIATQHSKRNFFNLYDVIVHCTFGKYLALLVNALIMLKDRLVGSNVICIFVFFTFFLIFFIFFSAVTILQWQIRQMLLKMLMVSFLGGCLIFEVTSEIHHRNI